jgi:hypothetical protein
LSFARTSSVSRMRQGACGAVARQGGGLLRWVLHGRHAGRLLVCMGSHGAHGLLLAGACG